MQVRAYHSNLPQKVGLEHGQINEMKLPPKWILQYLHRGAGQIHNQWPLLNYFHCKQIFQCTHADWGDGGRHFVVLHAFVSNHSVQAWL